MCDNPSSFLSRRGLRGALLSSAACLLALAGCSARPAVDAPAAAPASALAVESGFLSDYSRLRPSAQSASVFFHRDENLGDGYRRVSIRPVAVWRGVDASIGDVPEDDLQYLADALYRALERVLSASFEVVDEAGPGVLELEIGFTLVAAPDSSIHYFTTHVPVTDLSPRRGGLADGTRRFLQESLLEIEFRETVSPAPTEAAGKRPRGKKLVRAAFVDARRGQASPKAGVQTWEDVEALFSRWAATLDEQLLALRDGSFRPRLTTREVPATGN